MRIVSLSVGFKKDWNSALDMLVTFEEEGLQPRDRTLRYLAMALESDNQEVPFKVPDVTSSVSLKRVKAQHRL